MCANICRICGNITKEEDPIDLFQSNKDILQKIRDLTGIRLKKNLGLPKHMCRICKKDLNDAFKFRENFLKVQASFTVGNLKKIHKQTDKDLIEATEFVQVVVYKEEKNVLTNKHEYEEKEINIEESANDNNSRNSLKENKNEVNALELKPCEENTLDDTQIVKQEIVYNSEDAEIDGTEFISEEDNNEIDDDYKPKAEALISNTSKRKRKIKKQASVTKESKNSEFKTKAKKKHKHEEHPKIFICDQCGNNFTCRHHFKLHLRRHTGDKRCACELCPDKFFTSSELRRHMRRHTGERPFACKYCERRFTDYSTRIKHERTHTNERPFMCSQCGKSFTTSYILKNHMLTHTGERQFKCEVCNRAFTRRTHLVVHFRSIMHKQAVEKGKPPIPLYEISQQNPLIQQSANTSTFIV